MTDDGWAERPWPAARSLRSCRNTASDPHTPPHTPAQCSYCCSYYCSYSISYYCYSYASCLCYHSYYCLTSYTAPHSTAHCCTTQAANTKCHSLGSYRLHLCFYILPNHLSKLQAPRKYGINSNCKNTCIPRCLGQKGWNVNVLQQKLHTLFFHIKIWHSFTYLQQKCIFR